MALYDFQVRPGLRPGSGGEGVLHPHRLACAEPQPQGLGSQAGQALETLVGAAWFSSVGEGAGPPRLVFPSGDPGGSAEPVLSPAFSGRAGRVTPSHTVGLGRGRQGHGHQRWIRVTLTTAWLWGASDPVALTGSPVPSPGPQAVLWPGPPIWAGPLFVDIAPGPGIGRSLLASGRAGRGHGRFLLAGIWGQPPGQEGGGCLFDEATSGPAGPEGQSWLSHRPQAPRPGVGAQPQRGSGTLDASFGNLGT